MKCTRCGGEAVVDRGNQRLCGKCSFTSDWEKIIMAVQDARVETAVGGQPRPSSVAGLG
jgi:hypothetical protein